MQKQAPAWEAVLGRGFSAARGSGFAGGAPQGSPAELVFPDVPSRGLDEDAWRQAAVYILEARRGRTLLSGIHDRRDVTALGTHVAELP